MNNLNLLFRSLRTQIINLNWLCSLTSLTKHSKLLSSNKVVKNGAKSETLLWQEVCLIRLNSASKRVKTSIVCCFSIQAMVISKA